jgi:hypothetical protein
MSSDQSAVFFRHNVCNHSSAFTYCHCAFKLAAFITKLYCLWKLQTIHDRFSSLSFFIANQVFLSCGCDVTHSKWRPPISWSLLSPFKSMQILSLLLGLPLAYVSERIKGVNIIFWDIQLELFFLRPVLQLMYGRNLFGLRTPSISWCGAWIEYIPLRFAYVFLLQNVLSFKKEVILQYSRIIVQSLICIKYSTVRQEFFNRCCVLLRRVYVHLLCYHPLKKIELCMNVFI